MLSLTKRLNFFVELYRDWLRSYFVATLSSHARTFYLNPALDNNSLVDNCQDPEKHCCPELQLQGSLHAPRAQAINMSIYNWSVIIFSSAGIVGSVIPLPVHFRTTHHSAMVMTFWMVLIDLRYLINAIIWHDGRAVDDYMPQYCSVITTIQAAGSVALVSCSLCMIRDMWILVDRPEMLTPERRRRRGIAELLVCILWPLAFAALDMLARPRIYDLGSVDGCFVVMSPTWESIGVVIVWQPLIACWGGYYASTYELL